MIKYILFGLFVIFLFLKILFSTLKIKFFKYLFTPLVTITVISFPLLFLYNEINKEAALIVLALIFSLVGDMFNMFEEYDQGKLQFAMIFFSTVHIIYIITFIKYYKFAFYQIFIIIAILTVLIIMHILFKNNYKNLLVKYGSAIYMVIVSIMMFLLIGGLANKISAKSIMLAAGGILFWLSDLILGIDAFYKRIRFQSLLVWGTYAPAQLLIALSCYYN